MEGASSKGAEFSCELTDNELSMDPLKITEEK